MLDIIIQNNSIDIFQRILDTGTALIGYATGIITIYIAWLKIFSRNIKLINIGENFTDFYGDSFYCTIENQTLSTFSIKKVYIIDKKNKKELLLADYKPPVIFKPFETKIIENTYTSKNGDIDVFSDKTYVYIETTKCNIKTKLKSVKSEKKNNLIHISKKTFNGVVVSKDVRYVLLMRESDGTQKTIYINDVGDMSMQIFDFNSLRGQDVSSKEKIEEFFDTLFKPLNISYKIIDLRRNN